MILMNKHFRMAACIAFGFIFGWGLSYLILQPAISTLCHQVLRLPGPGAGIALIYGPLIIAAILLGRNILQGAWGAIFTAAGLAIFNILSDGRMPPSVGAPTILTALVSLTLGPFLELLIITFSRFKGTEMISAMFGNLFFICCYWIFIFPHEKGIPNTLCVIEIGAIALISGVLFSPLIIGATRRFLGIRVVNGRRFTNQER